MKGMNMNGDVQDLIAQAIELMAAERYEPAKGVCEQAIALDAKNFDAYMHLGNACVNLEDFAGGIAAFKKALLVQADSAAARYSLGCTLFLDGQGPEALKQFNVCEKAGAASAEMYGIMELIFLDAKDYVQAIRCANRAIQLEPLNPQHYMDKAQLFLLDGKTCEAVNCLHEVEDLLPDAGEPYILEARLLTQGDEHNAALAAIDRAVARFPLDAAVLLERVRVLNAKGDYREAAALAPRVRELAGDDAALRRELAMQEGIAQAGCEDIEASITALEGATGGDEQNAEALFLLVNECYATGRYEQAESYGAQLAALEGIELRYKAAGVFYNAASIDKLGREEEAAAAYKAATRSLRQASIGQAGMLEVYAYRAMCHKALGEYEKALSLCDHLVNMAPDNPSGYAFKADVCEAMGEHEQAEELRAKVRDIDPNFNLQE